MIEFEMKRTISINKENLVLVGLKKLRKKMYF